MQAVQVTSPAVAGVPGGIDAGPAVRLEPGVQATFCAMTFLAAELNSTVPRAASEEPKVAARVTV